MKLELLLTPKARADISDIWDHGFETWGLVRANKYLTRLNHVFDLLCDQPGIGQPWDHIRHGYRSHPAVAHLIFYHVVGDGLDVVRILHQRMDFEQHL